MVSVESLALPDAQESTMRVFLPKYGVPYCGPYVREFYYLGGSKFGVVP